MTSFDSFVENLRSGLAEAELVPGSKLVVAFSGGPDSTALLAGLAELRDHLSLDLLACHVNHGIRSETSHKDAEAARNIAKSLSVEFRLFETDVPSQAKSRKQGIEQTAREVRYELLGGVVEEFNAFGVVTGHTLDDQAETTLLHVARGSGLKGMSGMRAFSILDIASIGTSLNVIRPLLGARHHDCVEFCDLRSLAYVVDESNSSDVYARNRARHDALPTLERVSPGATVALARLAKNSQQDIDALDWLTENIVTDLEIEGGIYSLAGISDLPEPVVTRVLMRLFEIAAGNLQELERSHLDLMSHLVRGHSGTSIDLPQGVQMLVDKESFRFTTTSDMDDCPYPPVIEEATFNIPSDQSFAENWKIVAESMPRPANLNSNNPLATYASSSLEEATLRVRNRRPGDRFHPLGATGSKKLQDYFVDEGLPRRWRHRVPIVEANSEIAWIGGGRLSEWAKVQPDDDRVVRFEIVRR
jgi:tRNA(Ile)-lysidine synthase